MLSLDPSFCSSLISTGSSMDEIMTNSLSFLCCPGLRFKAVLKVDPSLPCPAFQALDHSSSRRKELVPAPWSLPQGLEVVLRGGSWWEDTSYLTCSKAWLAGPFRFRLTSESSLGWGTRPGLLEIYRLFLPWDQQQGCIFYMDALFLLLSCWCPQCPFGVSFCNQMGPCFLCCRNQFWQWSSARWGVCETRADLGQSCALSQAIYTLL